MKNLIALWAFLLILIFQPHHTTAQVELGECDGHSQDEKVMTNVNKAVKALQERNLQMAKIYVGNIQKLAPEHPHYYYLNGEVLLRQGQMDNAVGSWNKLFAICPDYRADLYFFSGVILYETGKEEEGKANLRKFLTLSERDRSFDKEAKAILKEGDILQDLLANPVAFDPQPVKGVSTELDEYLAIISPDNQYCFFTRKTKTFNKYDGPGAAEQVVELFSVAERIEAGVYTVGKPLSEPFNSQFNEGGASITADNNEMFLTICAAGKDGYNNCDLYSVKREYGQWGAVKSLGPHINAPNSWESQVSVSPNGQTIYFASDRAGGRGGIDLYKCERQPDGTWGAPINLGPNINTPQDEKSPFIHADSQTLYFSSNGHPGIGGFDIFMSKFRGGDWEEPKNIGYPINSEKDEVGLFVSLDGKKGFFNSNKLKRAGVGGWDLFSFDLPQNVRPEEVTLLSGTLLDGDRPTNEATTLTLKNLKTKEETNIQVDEATGNYAHVVRKADQADLIVKVEKQGVAFNSKFVDAAEAGDEGVIKADFEVSPMAVGKEYRLNDINFATNSFELDKKAQFIIDEFVNFLKVNPSVKVEIQGHTDNIGNPSDNQALSVNRAKSVYNYLLQKGITSSRLQSAGYGQDRPIADNNTEKGRAKNRRTVFVITTM
jgi:outer membrane protein OmpA-like peptidoglycan-associated protein/tetratricopeptide (TPR) repeat protein